MYLRSTGETRFEAWGGGELEPESGLVLRCVLSLICTGNNL